MICGDLNGKEIQKRGDIYVRITDSICRTAEINITSKAAILQYELKQRDLGLILNLSTLQEDECLYRLPSGRHT